MDARAFYREVLEEAARLGLGFWERIALILGASLVIVSFRALGSALRGIHFKITIEPPTEVDEGGAIVNHGATEGGGPPGGSETGGMGG